MGFTYRGMHTEQFLKWGLQRQEIFVRLVFHQGFHCSEEKKNYKVSKHGALMSTETIRLIRDREEGEGVQRWGEREIINLSLHCHNQNDSCIKMDSDEIHLNVSLTVRDKVTKQCP